MSADLIRQPFCDTIDLTRSIQVTLSTIVKTLVWTDKDDKTMKNTETFHDPGGVESQAKGPMQEESASTTITRIRWGELIRIRLNAIWLHRTDLWGDIRSFSSWFEFEAAPLAAERNESEVLLEFTANGTVRSLKIGTKPWGQQWDEFPRLWAFLGLSYAKIEIAAKLHNFKAFKHKLVH